MVKTLNDILPAKGNGSLSTVKDSDGIVVTIMNGNLKTDMFTAVNLGDTPNSNNGDPLRLAFAKINNFIEASYHNDSLKVKEFEDIRREIDVIRTALVKDNSTLIELQRASTQSFTITVGNDNAYNITNQYLSLMTLADINEFQVKYDATVLVGGGDEFTMIYTAGATNPWAVQLNGAAGAAGGAGVDYIAGSTLTVTRI